jgi:exodeoxyribonuclease VII small subunit
MTEQPPADVASLGYEAARDELVDIVARLETGQVGLEDSLALWQRGEALAAHCQRWLDRAEAHLTGTAAEESPAPG